MSESELVRDLVQEGIRQAMQLEALKNIRFPSGIVPIDVEIGGAALLALSR